MNLLRIALISFSPTYGETNTNLAKITRLVQEASTNGACLVCFPEMALTGYSSKVDILSQALCMESLPIQHLRRLASTHEIAIVAGMPEYAAERQAFFVSQFCCLPDDKVFVYQKTHLSKHEMETFQPGDKLGVFPFGETVVGLQLCYDAHFPELSLAQACCGARIILVCSASPMGSSLELRQRWLRYLPARAYDNGCYILTCNQHGLAPFGIRFSGLTMGFNPRGELIGETQATDQPLYLEIDLDQTARRPFLDRRRPELYRCAQRQEFK